MRAPLRRQVVLFVVVGLSLFAALSVPSALAASGPAYVEEPGTQPNVDTITDGSSVDAPWNTSQGITNFDSIPITAYPSTDLLPTFSFAGQTSSQTAASNGANVEPNVAVYPATTADEPFPSGFAGSPGPLSGYCGSSYSDSWDTADTVSSGNPAETSTEASQPAGETLPFAPYYFPYITRNANGTLTGYFDWRPEDADEAIVSATSSDNGETWTATGEALEEDPGYCPSADAPDNGLGHPYVAAFGSTSYLYTLQRAVGDYAGSSLDAFPVNPTATDPLSDVSSTASVGVDPNTFATAATPVPTTGGTATIPVSTLGGDATNGNSTSVTDSASNTLTKPDVSALPSGAAEYEDVTQGVAGSTPPVISCTGTSGATGAFPALTGCTSTTAGLTVAPNDDLIQVIGTAAAMVTDSSGTTATTIPYGPQNAAQTLGTDITLNAISTNTDTIDYLANADAPNRFYINGETVYCAQGNAEPTTKIELCETPDASGVPVTVGSASVGTPVISDPVIPSVGPNYSGGPASQTNGLISPDGIIGALPTSANSAWGEPSTGNVVLYTEKQANYFIEGGINGTTALAGEASTYTNDKTLGKTAPYTLSTAQTGSTGTLETGYVNTPGATPTSYNISPFPTAAEQLPTTGSFKVYVGAETDSGGADLDTLTCTGWDVNTHIADLYNPNLDTIDLLGCTSTTDNAGTDILNAGHQGNWVAGPGASIEFANSSGQSVLGQIGEGKALTSKNAEKLFGNNEDYEVVRAAYTTDGLTYTDLGAISGSTSNPTSTVSGDGPTDGNYTDITDPYQQYAPAGPTGTSFDAANPQGDSPTNGAIGAKDEVELRWPGARGTIIDNADGSIGLFLSGAWASDGDSDAFNQIYYTSSTDGGKLWSVPTIVQSTDYSFAASVAQDNELIGGTYSPLGVSAYYSGRAYDPTVVANPDGSLTMVFAGYRLPKPVTTAGTALGTNASALYCEGIIQSGCLAGNTTAVTETDPAIYRNILTETLYPNIGPMVAPTVSTGAASGVTASAASIAGTVQTDEPSTAVSIVYGTSPTNLSSSASAGSLNASTSTQSITPGSLSGLASGTTYYYAVQATNASGTSTGSEQSFTTTGSGPATATSTATVTVTSPTVTTPGATVTTPGATVTVTVPAKPSTTSTIKTTTATAETGNQKISVTAPSSAVCLAAPAKLSVKYKSAAVSGSKKTKLTFVHATFTLDGKVRATLTKASGTESLSLSGLRAGTYTLKVTSEYHDKSGTKTKTLTKTQDLKVKVC